MTRSSTVPDSATDNRQLVDALLSTSRVLVAATARAVSALDVDVTLPQYRLLVVLASRGPQRTVDLAHEFGVQSSTVTRMCDRLIRKGLVRRRQRPDDRRVAWLGLTEAGKDLVGVTMRRRRRELEQLVGMIELADPGPVSAALIALVEAAGEAPDPEWWDRWAVSAASG